MHSWCVESEKWVEICFHRWTSEKIPFLYFFLHKSWISQTLGHVLAFFLFVIFIMLQKIACGQKKIQISCMGSKPSQELIFFSCFRFLWIPQRPGTLNWKRLVFCCLKSYTSSVRGHLSTTRFPLVIQQVFFSKRMQFFVQSFFCSHSSVLIARKKKGNDNFGPTLVLLRT